MDQKTLNELKKELAVLGPKTYKQDGFPRAGATAENVARCEELKQIIEAAESDGGETQVVPSGEDTPTGGSEKDTRTPDQIMEDLVEENRRLKEIANAFKAPKGVAINKTIKPEGETIRIDEAMLDALKQAERLPVSIPEALAEGLIDKKKAVVLTKAVERRIRCYVKKSGSKGDPERKDFKEWRGGYKKGLTEENRALADMWLRKIGRVKPDPENEGQFVPVPEWDTSIVIPNM
jgi:hypothetical protein